MLELEIRSNHMAAAQIRMNAELAEAKKAAMVDPLTRLWNRAGGDEFLSRQQQLAVQIGEKFCIGMIDIDHFKKINDTYGHAAGDDVLREVARRILRGVRAEDFACRMGGEEFLLMLGIPDAAEACRVAQRVREGIRSAPVKIEGGGSVPVTVSMGLAYFDPAGTDSCEDVIKQADARLYEAKQSGRDRIVSHIDPSA